MANPRFPHLCTIYRNMGANSFDPQGQRIQLYPSEGEMGPCRKSSSDNIRTFNTGSSAIGKVDTVDYRISMPGIITGIQKGDHVDVEDAIGKETGLRIVNIEYTELQGGSTAVICNSPSN